jgi:major inositol transporter-like SP family MFS transporter
MSILSKPDGASASGGPATAKLPSPASLITGNAFVWLIAAIAGLGGLMFGYDTGIISAALLFVGRSFGALHDLSKEIITAAIVAGALVGCMTAGPMSDRYGRKVVVLLAAAIFIVGSLAAAWAPSVIILVVARVVLGVAIGATTQVVPVYIAELAPAKQRGALVVLFQLAIVGGILMSTIVGWLLGNSGDWRLMFLLGVIPGIILLLGMSLLPESPRFQSLTGRNAQARATLMRVRKSALEVDAELDAIRTTVRNERSWRDLFAPRLRPALVAGIGVAIFSQITGTNAIVYYAPTIMEAAGFQRNTALLTQIAIGITIVATTIFGGWAVDAWGRRSLMLRFLPVAALSLVLLGAMLTAGHPQGAERWFALAGLLGYEIFNVGSISVAIWLVGSEVFPLAVRGKGMSMVTLSHWSFDLLITLTTLSLIRNLGIAQTFWLFAAINALAWIFVWRCVPETRGHTLEQIEADLRGGTFTAARGAVA